MTDHLLFIVQGPYLSSGKFSMFFVFLYRWNNETLESLGLQISRKIVSWRKKFMSCLPENRFIAMFWRDAPFEAIYQYLVRRRRVRNPSQS